MDKRSFPVLHLIDSLAIGGAERMAVNFSNMLAARGYKVHLCASRAGGPLESFVASEVAVLILGRKSALDLTAIFRLVRYIRRNRIALVHAHSSSFFLATLIKPLTKTKIVWHDHFGGSDELPRRRSKVLGICSFLFSWIFSVNRNLEKWAAEKLMVPGDRVSYLPNFPALTKKSGVQPTLPGLRDSRIVCAARLNRQKDHHTLVRAMKSVHSACPEAFLLMVGFDPDDDYSRSVKSLIAELDLNGCIHLLGARTDMAEILSECCIGVLSSVSEGLPVALLEYGISGLPVVCTAVGECATVLGYGAFGKIVPPSRPDLLSKALIELLIDSDKRTFLGDSLKHHVNDNYSEDAIFKSVSETYGMVLGEY